MKNQDKTIILIDGFTFDVSKEYVPLGLLSIAALIPDNYAVELFKLPNSEEELEIVLESCKNAFLVGMSSISCFYPTTLFAAEKIKEVIDIPVILGGPQAAATAEQTLRKYDQIDFVIKGEAEESFVSFLSFINGQISEQEVGGLCFRDAGEIKTNESDIIYDLDRLPIPKYDLAFSDNPEYLSMEVGRGCPFHCSFCATSSFFSNLYRKKSVCRIIEEIKLLKEKFRPQRIDFMHDMMLADPKWVVELCNAMKENSLDIKWTCSARTDFVSYDLMAEMKSAGFMGIFFGIETGSPKIQMQINKKLKTSGIRKAITNSNNLDLHYNASFIGGFPDETPSDLRQTLELFFDFGSNYFNRNSVQFNLLTPLSGSVLTNQYFASLQFDGTFPDASINFSKLFLSENYLNIIEANPEIFSGFHYVPNNYIGRIHLKLLYYILYSFNYYPASLSLCYSQNKEEMLNFLISDLLPDFIKLAEIENDFNHQTYKDIVSKIMICFNFAEDLVNEMIKFDNLFYQVKNSKQDGTALSCDFKYDVLEATKGIMPTKRDSFVLLVKDNY